MAPNYITESHFPARFRLPACDLALSAAKKLNMALLHELDFSESVRANLPRMELTDTCNVQVLLNSSPWTFGGVVERSAHEAWTEAIEQSKHLVYIENEVFGGSTSGENRILNCLLSRLISAANLKEHFRVIVVLPFLLNGDILGDGGAEAHLRLNYRTICRGGKSLLERFSDACPTVRVSDFLCFFALRTYDVCNECIVTEQIYVKNKILVVDDRVLIVGNSDVSMSDTIQGD
ncbi:pldA, partial [Symbiodinium microadriaticum]